VSGVFFLAVFVLLFLLLSLGFLLVRGGDAADPVRQSLERRLGVSERNRAARRGAFTNLREDDLFRNDGEAGGTEVSDELGAESFWPWGLSVGDLNADGLQDLFVTASHFEGYGMVVTEALAHGLPVVGTDGGALRGTIPDGAGRIVPAADPAALAAAIEGMLAPEAFARAVAAAMAIRDRLPRWPDTAAVFQRVIAGVAGR